HGAPGTGKTELGRVLAAAVDARLYEVSDSDDEGDAAGRHVRLGKVALADRVLCKTPRSVLLFDEAEDALALSDGMMGMSRDTMRAKGWTHRMLESVRVPVIWTANSIDSIDRATLRRFSFVMEL